MKGKILCFLSGVLSTIIIISLFTFFTSYEKNVDSMLSTEISYKGVRVSKYLSSDACDYLTTGNRKIYFGELPPKESAIEINSPLRATIFVYPLDENSMIIRYEPRNGISRNYIKSDYGDFNRYLEVMYELTDNEVFNETVEY